MSKELQDALAKLEMKTGDIVFVDAKVIDPRDLALLKYPTYIRKRGVMVGQPDDIQIMGNRIIAVYPPDGVPVRSFVYSMTQEELKKLIDTAN